MDLAGRSRAVTAAALFRYRPSDTPVHRLPALLKLFLLLGTTGLAFSPSPRALVLVSFFLVLAAIPARPSPQSLLPAVRTLFAWGLFIACFRLLGKSLSPAVVARELGETGMYLWRLSAALLGGTLFYETTSGMEIRDALRDLQDGGQRLLEGGWRLLYRKPGGLPPRLPDFAAAVSLTLVFIPRVFETWNEAELAWKARGGLEKTSPLRAFTRLGVLIPIFLLRLADMAAQTERAVRNRSAQ